MKQTTMWERIRVWLTVTFILSPLLLIGIIIPPVYNAVENALAIQITEMMTGKR